MSCFIGVGELNKNLYILLLAVLFKVFSDFIYGIQYPLSIQENSLYIYESKLKDNLIIQSIFKFFGITVLSFFYYKYENQQVINIEEDSNDNNLNNKEKSNSRVSKKKKFLLIYNYGGPKNDKCKYISQILLMGFLLVFLELIIQFFNSVAPSNSDFWTFEVLFTALFMRKIFKIKLYIHQVFSISFILVLCSSMKFLLFLDNQSYKFNLYLLFIPGYILIVLIRSYVYTKIKWIIDIRYIFISKMLFIYGVFGFFISLIICILTSIIPGKIGEKIRYTVPSLDSFNWWEYIIEIILIIVYMCLKFLSELYYMLTLKHFSPMHVLVNDTFYYIIMRIIFTISKLLNYKINKNENKMVVYSALNHIFAFFGYLIFVELIELKFCECDYNLRKNIIRRSRVDSIGNNGLNEEINQSNENIQA